MPNHEETNCEILEFDSFTIRKSTKDGSYEDFVKEGEKITVAYNWLGEWEKRPSKVQIYRNYQVAIEKQGGKLLYSGSSAFFELNKSGEMYYFQVLTDGSGMYSVTTLKEAEMKQDIVFTAEEIENNMKKDGQITFYGIYFDTDKSILKAESDPSLKEIADYLKSNKGTKVYLVGHTDNTGTFDHNLTLSKARSKAVRDELIARFNVAEDQLNAEGVGDLCPVASNLTEEGRAKNRRVVMVLTK
jgi:outer membrane protein OmpA-like peptidoglycan-associated protein